MRRFVFHELIRDPERFLEVAAQAAPRAFEAMGPAGHRVARTMIGTHYRARDDDSARRALEATPAGFDHLEGELAGREYLAGGSFGVADLTAAALLHPIVLPPEAFLTVERMRGLVQRVRAEVRERPGFRWVEEMSRRHRRP
ncbi:MAG: hypothetical protein JST53_12660 [Actinobacteria bacterium]|nr:hypothetical protein [Actinomycetota bacterium]